MVVGLGVSKASTATFCAMQDGKWKNGKTEDVDSRSFFVRRRNENAYTTRKKNENFPVDFIRSLKPLDKRLQSAQTNIECRGVHFGSSNWMSMVACSTDGLKGGNYLLRSDNCGSGGWCQRSQATHKTRKTHRLIRWLRPLGMHFH